MSLSGMREEQIPPAPLLQRGEQHCRCFSRLKQASGLVRSFLLERHGTSPFGKGGQGGFALSMSPRYSQDANL